MVTMAQFDESTTLGDIVIEKPNAVGVLTSYGLDFCCGGQQSLNDACQELDVNVNDVLNDLSSIDTALPAEDGQVVMSDYRTLGTSDLVDHILVTHHAYLHRELPRLVELAEKIRDVHGDRHPELHEVARLVQAVSDDLLPHLAKEEQILFPLIKQLDDQPGPMSVDHPIARMRYEHEATGELLIELREVTKDYELPADACASYQATYEGLKYLEKDTHLHIHKENNILFPAAAAREAELLPQ